MNTHAEKRCDAPPGGEGNPANTGSVVSVRGGVVAIRFDKHLPPILAVLHAKEGAIVIEVLAQEGDLIIFNPMCLHSASANVSDVSRYVYFASFHHVSATWLREQLVEMKYEVPFPPGFKEALPAHARQLLDF